MRQRITDGQQRRSSYFKSEPGGFEEQTYDSFMQASDMSNLESESLYAVVEVTTTHGGQKLPPKADAEELLVRSGNG